jgi:hypothetical protein
VDPWVELALGAGIWFSHRRDRRGLNRPHGPARLALAVSALYVALMAAGTLAGRALASRTLPGDTRFMVAPVPALPFLRDLVADLGDTYQRGTVVLFPRPGVAPALATEDTGRRLPEADLAARSPEGRMFLGWARFPVYRVDREGPVALVTIGDARYPFQDWAEVSVRVARPVSLSPDTPHPTPRLSRHP